MKMLQSANNAILSTKASIDNLSHGLDDLADSVGVGPFVALVAGVVVVAASLGGISMSGLARVDEYFGWPLWSAMYPSWRSTDAKEHLKRRRDEVGSAVMGLVEAAIHKYYDFEDQDTHHYASYSLASVNKSPPYYDNIDTSLL